MTLLILFILLCLLLLGGMAVPFAFGGALLYLGFVADTDVASFLASGHWRMSNIVLLAIPLFILAGAIMNRGKLARAAGRHRVAAHGSAPGRAVRRLGAGERGLRLHLRQRRRDADLHRRHHAAPARAFELSQGVLGRADRQRRPLGLLIPPSSIQIIYAWITRQSVLKCFLGTVVPGLILITLLCLVNFVMMRMRKNIVVEEKPESFAAEARQRTVTATPALLMPVIILGGIYGGIMTPTESAAIAVLYALPVALWIYRGMDWNGLKAAVIESSATTGAVMVMFFMVMIVSQLLVFEDIPAIAQDFIFSISDNPISDSC